MVSLTYSFIFLTRRNYCLIDDTEKEQVVRKVFIESTEKHNLKLVKFKGEGNYVVLSVETSNPDISPAQISHHLRTSTSTIIRNSTLLEVSKLPSLWIRENWIGTNEPTTEELVQFIN